MPTPVDYDPFAQKPIPVDHDPFAKATAFPDYDPSIDIFGGTGGGFNPQASEAFVKGAGKGFLGAPGALEEFVAYKVPRWLGFEAKDAQSPTGGRTIFPTPKEVGQSALGRALGLMNIPKGYEAFDTIGEFVGGLATPGAVIKAGKRVVAAASPVASTIKTAFGSGVKTSAQEAQEASTAAQRTAENLRAGVQKPILQTLAEQKAEIEASEKELARIAEMQTQMAQREEVAAARAANRALDPKEVTKIQASVLERLRNRVQQTTAEVKRLGGSEAEARQAVLEAEGRIADARTAASGLADELLNKPQITPVEFGEKIRTLVQSLNEKYIKLREKAAKFDLAIKSAGSEPIVPTRQIIDLIDGILAKTANPEIENALKSVKARLTTSVDVERPVNRMTLSGTAQDIERGTEAQKALTLERADSLRKWLNQVLSSKKITLENGGQGSIAAAVHDITEVRNLLMEAAGTAHDPYKKAVEAWARMSEPGRMMQGKGPLRRIIQRDLQTQEDLIGSADVVGHLLREAKSGKPVIQSLIANDPSLVNSARMYFNRELFGGGTVPTNARLGQFLKENEGVLRHLRLYDEFSTLRGAQQAAQKAVDIAIEAEKASARAVSAVGRERAAAGAAETEARRLARIQQKRIQGISDIPTVEDIAASGSRKAKDDAARINRMETAAKSKKGAAEKTTSALETMRTELVEARPDEMATIARSKAKQMVNDKIITDAQYAEYLRAVKNTEDAFNYASQKARTAQEAQTARQTAQRDLVVSAAKILGLGALGQYGISSILKD